MFSQIFHFHPAPIHLYLQEIVVFSQSWCLQWRIIAASWSGTPISLCAPEKSKYARGHCSKIVEIKIGTAQHYPREGFRKLRVLNIWEDHVLQNQPYFPFAIPVIGSVSQSGVWRARIWDTHFITDSVTCKQVYSLMVPWSVNYVRTS